MEITISEAIDGLIALLSLGALITFINMVLQLPITTFLERLV